MNTYIRVDLVTLSLDESETAKIIREGEPPEIDAELQKIFFDGIEHPTVNVIERGMPQSGEIRITAKVEILNLAGDEEIGDIRDHFEGLLDRAVADGKVHDWAISVVAVDGLKTKVNWSPATKAALSHS